ncbi:hypothetical protein [Curtobacterium flaccumfaciens]|uniref:hypothetical protein n=1 Tax=Curtobacterium flaccumfaciens TaxID=2035 RepID=UPI001367843D|nr:hypothetical protein [Curtobacterium flaccumfaciens]MBT1667320.1 hypothetical protein [Curtobacterium flaccumfaciens pv. flaccumfaciens]QHN62890.1 hypothetical protein GBG65_19865 [Curtobacterium flaccumfaciens pv. flaccumfaciens]
MASHLANAVTLVHHTSTRADPELEQRIVKPTGACARALVKLPFEVALDESGTIEWDKLSDQSHEAWLAATAAVIDGIRSRPCPRRSPSAANRRTFFG